MKRVEVPFCSYSKGPSEYDIKSKGEGPHYHLDNVALAGTSASETAGGDSSAAGTVTQQLSLYNRRKNKLSQFNEEMVVA